MKKNLDKTSLRRHFLHLREAVTPDQAQQAAEAICSRIFALIPPEVIIAGYIPLRGEVDILPALHALRRRGNRLALPVMGKKNAPLVFCRWEPGEALVNGRYGVQEPQQKHEITPDVVLTPLLAFDKTRYRLGYGGGYYDRTLAALKAENPRVQAMGIAYHWQEVDALPKEAHDAPLDAIVTDTGIIP